MPSGWDVYYVVALAAVFALSLPLSLKLISILISKGSPQPSPAPVQEAPLEQGRRTNSRFFLAANAALLLITFGLILIPCAGMLSPAHGTPREILAGVISILTVAVLAAVGLLYSARKGDLNWVRSLRGKPGA